MEVVIGSTNQAKIDAVSAVFDSAFSSVRFTSLKAESGISDQPMTDEESIQGSINRADDALKQRPDADYAVGLEGNVAMIAGRMLLNGWVAIRSQDGGLGLGRSGGVVLPKSIQDRLEQGEELGPLVQSLMNDEQNTARHSSGTNGILTDGLYTRVDEFTHATQCALAPFVRPDMYR